LQQKYWNGKRLMCTISQYTCSSALICGSAMALLYTGAGLKYRALGDMVILVAFGPAIMVFVSCALLDSRSHALAIPLREIGWYSLAFSALTVAVLHANNARDAKQDAKSGVLLA
jgi:1,4-dihydroxy-2-naphthoate octaprenyltransferase